MADIRTSIAVEDRMSRILRGMVGSVNTLIDSMEQADRAGNRAMNPATFKNARLHLDGVEKEWDQIHNSVTRADKAQDSFFKKAIAGIPTGNMLTRAFAFLGGGYMVGQVVRMGDEFTNASSRVGLINDGLQTQKELMDSIYQASLRSRGGYTETAQLVAKLGQGASGRRFDSSQQIVDFSEILNKQLRVGGASESERSSTLLQLSQAMGSGRLQGDEYRSIIENAPLLATSIEDYMRNVKKASGSMKDWAKDGELTAEVIKAAMFNSAEEVDKKFKELPMTFGMAWTQFTTMSTKALEPVYKKLGELFNSPEFQDSMNSAIGLIQQLGSAMVVAVDWIMSGLAWISENWDTILTVVASLVTAYTVLVAIQKVQALVAMLAAGWQIIALVAVIAAIVAVAGWFLKLVGVTDSVFGAIMGIIFELGAMIWNVIAGVVNFIIGIIDVIVNSIIATIEFIINMTKDFWGSMKNFGIDFLDFFLNLVKTIVRVIDDLFGSKMADALERTRSKLDGSRVEIEGGVNFGRDALGGAKLDRIGYMDAFNAGNNIGSGIENSLKGLDANLKLEEFGKVSTGGSNPFTDTAENTAQIADAVTASGEDIAMIRDIAEREAINKFTTAEIKVDMKNDMQINSEMDVDGVVRKISGDLAKQLEAVSEGA